MQVQTNSFCDLMGISSLRGDAAARAVASFPARLGGLGLKSAVRTSQAAYVASWADVLGVLGAKVPGLGRDIAQALSEGRAGKCACLQEAAAALAILRAEGLEAFPQWEQVRGG